VTQHVRSEPGDLAPGDQVAGYRIQERIGRGGMAVVYRALDLRLGRPVALKVLAPELGADEAFRQRFIRESRAAAGVDHPHIIPVFEAGESAGVLFIAMRYVSNGDVRSLIEAEGRLRPARAAAIASQVASALDAAHARGLVHRDVKPGNMLLGQASTSDADHVYLSDFGLSKHSVSPSTLTSTGQFLGTLDYVSPEQIQGHPVDGRADQYALACAVVEMLTGTPPFHREDTRALMWAQLEAAPPRLSEGRPELPPAVDQVIGRALAKSPANRYATCSDFATALTAACASAAVDRAGLSTAHADPVPVSPHPDRWPVRTPSAWPADSWPTTADALAGPTQTAEPGWGGQAAGPSGLGPGRASPAPHAEQELAKNFLTPGPPPRNARSYQPPSQSAAPPGARPGSWPGQPSPVSAGGRPPPTRHTGRNVAIGLLVAVLVLGVAGIVAYRLAHRNDRTSLPPVYVTHTVTPSAADPAATVRAYFDAINRHRYGVAWVISGEKEPYQKFVAGFAGTAHDAVTILSENGDVVTARLAATQTDGLVKTYQGTYTVSGGVITGSNIQRIS